jgi:nicotinate-nucleotide adenylyltransferase
MADLVCREHPEFTVSRVEAEMDEPGYTLNVVRELKKRYPDVTFFFIIGADNVSRLETWYRPESIFREVVVLAGGRPGYSVDTRSLPDGFTIDAVSGELIDISATDIRSQIAAGIDIEHLSRLVPPPVAEYILEHKLYVT